MRRPRAGIVGTGFAASSHVDALRRIGMELGAIAGSSRDKARAFAEPLGVETHYGDYLELLADDSVDVVHNCTPNHLHAAINEAAIAAGKHLLSEKPLAMTSSETEHLAELAGSSNAVAGVCFNYRHYPLVQQMRCLLQDGAHGRPHLIHGSYLQYWLLWPSDWNWRLESAKAGLTRALGDIGSHWIDVVQHVTGDTIVEVSGDLGTLHPERMRPHDSVQTFESAGDAASEATAIDTEDFATVLLRFESGARGSFLVSQVSAGRKNRLWFEIDLTDAALAWDQEEPNTLWIGRRDEANRLLARDPSLLSPEAAPLAHFPGGHQEGWPDGLKNLFIDFYATVGAVEDGGEHSPSFATFAEAHRVTQTVEAIAESARARSWVEVGRRGG